MSMRAVLPALFLAAIAIYGALPGSVATQPATAETPLN